MNSAYVLNRYHTVSTQALSQEQLLLRLFAQAVRDVSKAKLLIGCKDWAGKGIELTHAMTIVDALDNALDHTLAVDVTAQLSALYGFVRRELMRANQKCDARACDNAVRVLKQMQNMWQLAIDKR
jgi:flagellar protein FliS